MSDIQQAAPVFDLGYDLDETISADTPARLKAVGHRLRALILDLVLERAMTVSELAERVGKPRGTVAHHVDVLVNAGLLKVTAKRKVRAIEERFYGRTAYTIMFPPSTRDGDLPFVNDARAEADMSDAATMTEDGRPVGGFTLRHARIPAELANEFTDRVMALAAEFARLPRGGTREYAFLAGVFATNRPVAPKDAR
ncbi:MAG TPA: winged helix-turn-helix domain-containing protein [Ilumatobacteraceae bacterium]|nr:winged helix-turn-helix domain-containing protein [Ilumatobacteraceae bacterium]